MERTELKVILSDYSEPMITKVKLYGEKRPYSYEVLVPKNYTVQEREELIQNIRSECMFSVSV